MDATTLQTQAERFLAELRRSPATLRAYRADLKHLMGWLKENGEVLSHKGLNPSFVFAEIPPEQARDALLFRLVFETGLRIGEALGAHVEDLDLTRGDEHLTVLGKGGRKRTVLLDDPQLVNALRRYLRTLGHTHGPLFQATKNRRARPLRSQSVQERWQEYTRRAGISCTLHQLRHSHATELVKGGVSLATIRMRLGHPYIQTTLRYAEVSDPMADAEVRHWRRRRT